jgi:hypothetical protein
LRLRQVALVAGEIAPVREDIFTLLGIDADYDDKGVGEFGLCNSVMSMGDTFLEVVSPIKEGTTAGRLLRRREGNGGYMVLAQVDDIDEVSQRVNDHEVRKIWEVEREEVKAFHVHPKDIGAAIVSFDQMNPAEEWTWGGPVWRENTAKNVGNITACDLQAVDPESLAKRWSSIFSRKLVHEKSKFTMMLDDGSRINFIEAEDGRGDGVCGLEFSVLDAEAIRRAAGHLHLTWHFDEVMLCGTRFRFRF